MHIFINIINNRITILHVLQACNRHETCVFSFGEKNSFWLVGFSSKQTVNYIVRRLVTWYAVGLNKDFDQ